MNECMHASMDDHERRQDETKAAYLAAVRELFRLLELPPDQRPEDHRKLLMEANDACGRRRVAMLEAWEGSTWRR